MKKKIFIVAFIFTVFVHAMEKENKWSITAYGTKINLHQADILEYYADDRKKEDVVICVGQYKQEELGVVPMASNLLGYCCEQQTVTFRPKKDSIHYQKLLLHDWYFPIREDIKFLVVTEPRVFNLSSGAAQYWYADSECYTKELAIQESRKDLLRCYNTVLNKGIELLKEKEIKNIALPMLGADSHYEHARMFKEDVISIAVNAVLECIKNNSKAYDNVELFMEEMADFNHYKELLMQWRGKENVLLLYFAQKDSENIFALLPYELISYIAKLI